MRETEVINRLAAETGETTETCALVVKGFEKVSEEKLISRFHGDTFTHDQVVEMVSEFTGAGSEACRRIIDALEHTLELSLENKLCFWRKKNTTD